MSALAKLVSVNGMVSLGLQVGSVVIPLIKGLITKIEADKAGGTVTYTVLIQTDDAELVSDVQVNITDLVAINSEMALLKQPPLPVPSATLSPQAAPVVEPTA